jgi:hypothetical protein
VASLAQGTRLVTAGEDRAVCVWAAAAGATGGWALEAALRGGGSADVPRCVVALGGPTRFAVLGARDSLRLFDAALDGCGVLTARAGGCSAAAPLAWRAPASGLTVEALALAEGAFVTAELGCSAPATTYLDDDVRLLVRLAGPGGSGTCGSRLAAATEGGTVHFLELTA